MSIFFSSALFIFHVSDPYVISFQISNVNVASETIHSVSTFLTSWSYPCILQYDYWKNRIIAVLCLQVWSHCSVVLTGLISLQCCAYRSDLIAVIWWECSTAQFVWLRMESNQCISLTANHLRWSLEKWVTSSEDFFVLVRKTENMTLCTVKALENFPALLFCCFVIVTCRPKLVAFSY